MAQKAITTSTLCSTKENLPARIKVTCVKPSPFVITHEGTPTPSFQWIKEGMKAISRPAQNTLTAAEQICFNTLNEQETRLLSIKTDYDNLRHSYNVAAECYPQEINQVWQTTSTIRFIAKEEFVNLTKKARLLEKNLDMEASFLNDYIKTRYETFQASSVLCSLVKKLQQQRQLLRDGILNLDEEFYLRTWEVPALVTDSPYQGVFFREVRRAANHPTFNNMPFEQRPGHRTFIFNPLGIKI
jgi:hypothetical protein